MNENLFDKVSVESMDKLVDALVDVMKDMKEAELQEEKRYSNDKYVTCLKLNYLVLSSLKRRIKKQG